MRLRHLPSLIALTALTAATAGCGTATSTRARHLQTGTPAAFKSSSANPVAAPPLTAAALHRGSAAHQITEAIVAFYRAEWEDDATAACAQFSDTGRTGFMHAAHTAFPQAVTGQSTCEHAMEIYNAALDDSASTAQDNDANFNPAGLNDVGVTAVQIDGATATAIAPTNVVELINPEQIDLVRQGGRWLIDASHSLNASNLPKILARARARGLLARRRGK